MYQQLISDRVVGFRIGKHKGGHNCVGSPEGLAIISPPIEAVRWALQTFLQEEFTKFAAHDTMTYSGQWRSATVRSTKNGDTMLALDFVADKWEDSVSSLFLSINQSINELYCRTCRISGTNTLVHVSQNYMTSRLIIKI